MRLLKPYFPTSLLLFLLSLLWGCQTVPETGRSAVHLIPKAELDSMSNQAFNDIKQQLPVSKDPQKNAMLRRVGDRIVTAARARGADLPPPEQWEFVVFEDEQVNAFALPGGKVGFYTGIFKLFQKDDDCAVVMGHEIAHVAADHGNERASQQLLAAGFGQVGAIGLSQSGLSSGAQAASMAALGLGTQVGVLLPFSRTHESEADHIGLVYMSAAGYDPRASVPLWEKMGAQGGSAPPEFLSTHPDYHTRIKRLKSLIPQVLPLYEKASKPK